MKRQETYAFRGSRWAPSPQSWPETSGARSCSKFNYGPSALRNLHIRIMHMRNMEGRAHSRPMIVAYDAMRERSASATPLMNRGLAGPDLPS